MQPNMHKTDLAERSIHLCIFWHLSRVGSWGGSSLSREVQTSLSTATSSSSSGRMLKCSQASWNTLSLQGVLGPPRVVLPEEHALKASPGRRPRGILTRFLSHLIWILLTQRNIGSWRFPLFFRSLPKTTRTDLRLPSDSHHWIKLLPVQSIICASVGLWTT